MPVNINELPAGAWEVAVRLGLHVGPWVATDSTGPISWYAASHHDWDGDSVIIEVAETVELAIYRAALKIIERKSEK